MRRVFKLPTFIGLLVLIVGIASGIFLINSSQLFKLGAQDEAAPKNVRITNITGSSVTITWTTDIEAKGFVKWGESRSVLSQVALDELGETAIVHSATVTPIKPNTEVFFKINSQGSDWDNDGLVWQTKTLNQSLIGDQSTNATGSVVNQTGEPPAAALVFINVNGITLSSPTSVNGSWIIPLSNYVEVDPINTPLEISVNAGNDGSATAVIYPAAAKNTPLIVLGKTYDFRTITTNTTGAIPQSELSIPESIQASSRFEIGDQSAPNVQTVTLESHDDGEIVNTTDPEFFGNAPRGTEIEIEVQSELQTEKVTASTANTWRWSPPNNLEPGEHTLTIKWRDSAGILRTISRSFIVSAAEGPAFVSTPSATPTQSAIPSSTPTTGPTSTPVLATETPEALPTITASPVALPDSGTLTPTLVLFIMGLGVITTSIFVWRKADA